MKTAIILLSMIAFVLPAKIWPSTRQEVIDAATAEAATSYQSAATGTVAIGENVYHANYLLGFCGGHCIDHIYNEWSFIDSDPQQHTWYGAPFCFGGTSMGSDCQTKISGGYGVGATSCNWSANGQTTYTWAAGLDCSHFVCKCLGISYKDTSNLPGQCNQISWDALQPGDLLIYSGQHVMIFLQWDDSQKASYTAVHASNEAGKTGSGRVWVEAGRSRFADDSYVPHTPKCISGDPAASLAGFRVESAGGVPLLVWETESERNTRAFWIERASHPDGPWEKVTESIPARGSNVTGLEYRATDSTYPGGMIYYRLIEQETGWRIIVKGVVAFD